MIDNVLVVVTEKRSIERQFIFSKMKPTFCFIFSFFFCFCFSHRGCSPFYQLTLARCGYFFLKGFIHDERIYFLYALNCSRTLLRPQKQLPLSLGCSFSSSNSFHHIRCAHFFWGWGGWAVGLGALYSIK